MNFIIDGYNLGFKNSRISSQIRSDNTEDAIQSIIYLIRSKLTNHSGKTIVVFDGKEGVFPKVKFNNIQLKFSIKPQTADDIIKNFIRKNSNNSRWTVITSDNEIIQTAKAYGVKIIKSEQFINQSETKPPKQKQATAPANNPEKYHPDKVDIDLWMKLFNDND
jgi:predicted RNA-binding protein with PIN domain